MNVEIEIDEQMVRQKMRAFVDDYIKNTMQRHMAGVLNDAISDMFSLAPADYLGRRAESPARKLMRKAITDKLLERIDPLMEELMGQEDVFRAKVEEEIVKAMARAGSRVEQKMRKAVAGR